MLTPIRHASTNRTVVLVFGSPAFQNGSPQPRLLNTLHRALQVLRANPEATVILTGGAVHHPFSEAAAMCMWLNSRIAHNQRQKMLLETQSRNTLENVLNVLPTLIKMRPTRIFLVTVQYHMQRALTLTQTALASRHLEVDCMTFSALNDLTDPSDLRKVHAIEKEALIRDQRLLKHHLNTSL